MLLRGWFGYEQVDEDEYMVVDEDNVEKEAAPLSRIRSENLMHRVSYVVVFYQTWDTVVVHRRRDDADLYPGTLDPCISSMLVDDDSYEEAALHTVQSHHRLPVNFQPKTRALYKDNHCKVWGCVFACLFQGNLADLYRNSDTVSTVQLYQILHGAAVGKDETYTPDSLFMLRRLVRKA